MHDDRVTRRLCRRRWLIESGWGLLGCAGLFGCANVETPPDDGRLRVELRDIPDGERMVLRHEDTPIEIRRDGDTVSARLLLCTHFGCEVEWSDAESVYECPCHDARFDAEGRVLSGPPSRPLQSLPVERLRDLILVDLRG